MVIPFLTWPLVLGGVLLSLVYLVPRLIGIDRLVTSDETLWLGRSANFYTAFVHRDWANTYQFVHPGVMTMWAGAIGYFTALPDYPLIHPGQYRTTPLIHIPIREQAQDPLFVLIVARIVKLLFQLVFYLVAIRFVQRIFGTRTAIATALLLSFEPFLIAHDRLLHIDGLFAIASFAAVLCIARAGQLRDSFPLWVLAGVLSAMAWLTRSTGIVLVPVAGLAALLPMLGEHGITRSLAGRRAVRYMALRLAVFGTSALVTTVALFPALWVTPRAVLSRMLDWTENAATEGHEAPIIFNGHILHGDPGWRFYPVTLLFRLSPATLAGVVIAVGVLAWTRIRRRPQGGRHSDDHRATPLTPLLIILGFAVAYGLGMDVGAKKFDRYILPDYPVLDLIAAVGWLALATWLWARRRRVLRIFGVALVVVPLSTQGLSAVAATPYGLDYFSPFIGGIEGADGNLIVGWGEGMDQAAHWILAQPGGSTATVLTSANRTSILYFMPESVTVPPPRDIGTPGALDDWIGADYYVSYIQQWERNAQMAERGYIDTFEPVHRIFINSLEFVRIYDLRAIPIPPAIVAGAECPWQFGDGLTLVAGLPGFVVDPYRNGRVQTIQLTFLTNQTDAARAPAEQYRVRVRLNPAEFGRKPYEQDIVLTPSAIPGVPATIQASIVLPFGKMLAYDIEVTVYDPVTGAAIVARQPTTNRQGPIAFPQDCGEDGRPDG